MKHDNDDRKDHAMTAKDVLKMQMDMGLTVLKTYISDWSDRELLLRPGKGCNHGAWQIGHLIAAEADLLNSVCPGAAASLPVGFVERHSKETAGVDDPAKFLSKQQYLDLYDKQRAATQAALDKLPDADLDRPSPEKLRKMFPTVGSIFGLIAGHPLMHAGQFVAVRRQLGKPVLI
jgi:hypothetical protein